MSDMSQVWGAFDEWERTQVCIRGHVRVVREDIEKLVAQLEQARGIVLGYRSTISGLRDDATDPNISDEEFRELFVELYLGT